MQLRAILLIDIWWGQELIDLLKMLRILVYPVALLPRNSCMPKSETFYIAQSPWDLLTHKFEENVIVFYEIKSTRQILLQLQQ